ncbi:hypothetical protein TRVL_02897 [Trypanosoma vivax]|nr:hypothetical protein TRVL_02897 [Trypanosoma vivax]
MNPSHASGGRRYGLTRGVCSDCSFCLSLYGVSSGVSVPRDCEWVYLVVVKVTQNNTLSLLLVLVSLYRLQARLYMPLLPSASHHSRLLPPLSCFATRVTLVPDCF